MAVMMKLKYIDELSGGRKRFRRRYPKAIAKALGEDFFQVPMKARDGAALAAEQERHLAAYNKIVRKAQGGAGQVSSREQWEDALKEAEAMLEGITGGLDEDDKREVLADDLRRVTVSKTASLGMLLRGLVTAFMVVGKRA